MAFLIAVLQKYKKMIFYLLCSVASALAETGIGWVILHAFDVKIVVANTIAVIIGAVIHYILTSFFVFKVKYNIASFIVYVLTFAVGLGFQNVLIWVFYERLFINISESLNYLLSKALSLVIPFFAIYYLRKTLNAKFCDKNEALK